MAEMDADNEDSLLVFSSPEICLDVLNKHCLEYRIKDTFLHKWLIYPMILTRGGIQR